MSLRQLLRVPDWVDEAACKDAPVDWFFAEGKQDDEKKLPGMEVCKRCSVVSECLDYALTNRLRDGIFGGKTSKQRRRMRKLSVVRRPEPSRPQQP